MKRFETRATVAFALLCVLALAFTPVSAQTTPPKLSAAPANELDAFMEKVLKRREFNRQTLEQYVLDEVERFEVLGPTRMPVYRHKREYTWYVRDGLHVRSPVRFDGVTVGDDSRKTYEADWARRERSRLERRKEKDGKAATPVPIEPSEQAAGPSGATPIPTPRFVSEAYFMDFKFEAGNYYLAGREQLEGHEVLRIEYYPKRMFNDDDEQQNEKPQTRGNRQDRRERETEQRIERQMNKTALVTLWVDPVEHQIVKYTFDNVWMDFLPAGWLVRVDDIRASMTMGQPFQGVWLPREMNIHAGVTLATGSLEAAYERRFSDYKQANVKSLIRIPKEQVRHEKVRHETVLHDEWTVSAESGVPLRVLSAATRSDGTDSADTVHEVLHDEVLHEQVLHEQVLHEPALEEPFRDEPSVQNPTEVITEIRVHGNAYLRDEEVIRLAGVAIGQGLGVDGLREIEQRLKASGHFETVEIRKRYRSLESATDVALVLLVHERPGFRSETVAEHPSSWPWARMRSRLMFLPILGYDDGYGLTYGGRVSTIDLLGAGERLSVPLTWGGTRRAALEVERTFTSGPLTRIESTFGISQRENPRFELDDRRVKWTTRAERSIAGLVRTGVETSQSTVKFGQLDDRLWTIGVDAALDTRGDPAFPRNAVMLGAGWTTLHVRRLEDPINRYTTDARGYLGLVRQSVLAARLQYSTADRPLPAYERLLLGGASTLRGFRTGSFDGDRLFVTSAELRVPITSVLSGAKLGLTAFVDAGKAYDVGQRLKDVQWHRGVGGGLFLIATVVRINLDVAHGLKDGDTRVHLSSGFAF